MRPLLVEQELYVIILKYICYGVLYRRFTVCFWSRQDARNKVNILHFKGKTTTPCKGECLMAKCTAICTTYQIPYYWQDENL